MPEAVQPRHPHDRLRRLDGNVLVERGQLAHLRAPREQAEAARAALDLGPGVEVGPLGERAAVARAGAAGAPRRRVARALRHQPRDAARLLAIPVDPDAVAGVALGPGPIGVIVAR